MSDNEFVDLSTVPNRNTNYAKLYDKLAEDRMVDYDAKLAAETNWTESSGHAEAVSYVPNENTPQEKVENWPSDDAVSLQQGSGSANLDIFYANQYYENELHTHNGHGNPCGYGLDHTPIMAGSVVGTIQLLADAELQTWQIIQSFVFSVNGECVFADNLDNDSDIKAISGNLDLFTGSLGLMFDDPPGEHRIVVSYESQEPPEADEAAATFANKRITTAADWKRKVNHAKMSTEPKSSQYIDYLVNQLSDTKSKLYDAEEKLAAIHKGNGGNKTLAELEVEMYNEYDKKLKDIKEYMVDKVDEFLKKRAMDDVKAMTPAEIVEEALQN